MKSLSTNIIIIIFCLLIYVFACCALKKKKEKSDGRLYSASEGIDYENVVIVLSNGRSGSSALCLYVGNIIDGNSELELELFGKNELQMMNKTNPLNLMKSHLKYQFAKYPQKGAGFKVKPYLLNDEKYEDVWRWISDHRVKVVYNKRNPLDVLISTDKHGGVSYKVYPAHCKIGDERCLKKTKAVRFHFEPSVERIDYFINLDIKIMTMLQDKKINYYDITYEDLHIGNEASRLRNLQMLSNFLRPGRVVTMKDFEIKWTESGHHHQNETITNFLELSAYLTGTRYEKYLN